MKYKIEIELNENLADKFEKKVFTRSRIEMPYRLMLPQGYNAGQKYPLAIFLHGAAERGYDNENQLQHGVLHFASVKNRNKFPCFVLVPQCPDRQWWTDWERKGTLKNAIEIIEYLKTEYSINDDQIYITGISMGGFGTFEAINRVPDYFAAAVPVCGGGNPFDVSKMLDIPIWVFHGEKDDVVDVSFSRKMVSAIRNAGGNVKYTEYPNIGHESWEQAYREPELFSWIFSQERGRVLRV